MPSAPAEPEGRDLLAGKSVVVTAAAGTGIGSAVAKRAIVEGGSVLISDIHERRLGEAADKRPGRARVVEVDVGEEDAVEVGAQHLRPGVVVGVLEVGNAVVVAVQVAIFMRKKWF